MRQHNYLCSESCDGKDLVYCLPTAKGVLAVERIVEDNGPIRNILFPPQMRQKKCERERCSIACAQGGSKGWSIRRRSLVAAQNGYTLLGS